MNLTSAQFLIQSSRRRGPRVVSALVAIVSVFLLTAVPALADTLGINQVVQTLTSAPGSPDLRLNTLAQDPNQAGNKGSKPQAGPRNDSQASNQGGAKNDSALSGVSVSGGAPQLGVDIIEEGEVEGTICDCGEILVAGAAFPKWPFLFLGAVPLIFIHDCHDCDQEQPTPTPTPTPPLTPTPTPPGVPEPATLFLFGTGLAAFGAGLRRRYAKTKFADQMDAQEEE